MSKELETRIDGLKDLMIEKHNNLNKTTDKIEKSLEKIVGLPEKVKYIEKDLKCHKKGHWKFVGIITALLGLLAVMIVIGKSIFTGG